MAKEDFFQIYRGFRVYPFKGNGVVERISGGNEFVDKNGYRTIRDKNNIIRYVSHIIYAVGYPYPSFTPLSYLKMKNFIISYKDGNRANCNFNNLVCKFKKSYIKKVQFDKELAKYI